ncbi:MAG: hypothetical protein HY319_25825 [Armatimonadetes bacterium]|nr:hypothetical protein [Armatimonadota bacterium]
MLTEGEFLYRARVLTAPSTGKLKALVRMEGPQGRCHRDTLDLYSHKARKMFSNRAAERFQGLSAGGVEAQLERLIDQAELLSSRSSEAAEARDVSMTDSETGNGAGLLAAAKSGRGDPGRYRPAGLRGRGDGQGC